MANILQFHEIMNQDRHKIIINEHLNKMGISDHKIIEAMDTVPRELFLPLKFRSQAYVDSPLPIGEDQTISQPSLVAYMTQKLQVKKSSRVLEIGTGSGYQTAILGQLAHEVFTIELLESLSHSAQERLTNLGYYNIEYKIGDGSHGWAEKGPFDRIIVTAGAAELPAALVNQLAPHGRMIIPLDVGSYQDLFLVTKDGSNIDLERLIGVSFVPLVTKPREKQWKHH